MYLGEALMRWWSWGSTKVLQAYEHPTPRSPRPTKKQTLRPGEDARRIFKNDAQGGFAAPLPPDHSRTAQKRVSKHKKRFKDNIFKCA